MDLERLSLTSPAENRERARLLVKTQLGSTAEPTKPNLVTALRRFQPAAAHLLPPCSAICRILLMTV